MQTETYGKLVIFSKEAEEGFRNMTEQELKASAQILADNLNETLAELLREKEGELKSINIDLDCASFKDVEVVCIKRKGKTISLPVYEFWQTLEKYNDCDGCEFW